MPTAFLSSKVVTYLPCSDGHKPDTSPGTASWCAQCKAIAPEVTKMASEYEGRATFYTFDVDSNPDVAQELGISTMPTFVIFKDGDLQDNVSGAKPKELRSAVEQSIA